MTLNFDQTMAMNRCPQRRPSNGWPPRALTAATRRHFVTSKMEQDLSAGSVNVPMVNAAYVAAQLAKKDGGGGGGETEAYKEEGDGTLTVVPALKMALGPNVLTFGQNGAERLRLGRPAKRSESAGPQPRSGRFTSKSSTGSPYLEDLCVTGNLHQHMGHHQPPFGLQPDRGSQQDRQHQLHARQSHSPRQDDGRRTKDSHGDKLHRRHSSDNNSPRQHHTDHDKSPRPRHSDDNVIQRRRHSSDDERSRRQSHGDNSGRESSSDERIGRCNPDTAKLYYKAALVLMQARRPPVSLVQTSAAASPRVHSRSHHLPQHHHHQQQQQHCQQHQPDILHHFRPPSHRRTRKQPKSILRQPPTAFIQGRSLFDQKSISLSRPFSDEKRHASPARIPQSITSRKRVTFSDDVALHLQSDLSATARVLTHRV